MSEKMMSVFVKIGGLGALLVCFPVMWRIHQGDNFNPISYLLWSALSLVTAVVLFRAKKGGTTMMAGYVLSDFSIGAYAYYISSQPSFGKVDGLIVVLTIICVVLFLYCEKKKNYTPSVIANATACMVAGIPQIIETYGNPHSMSYMICGAYMLVCVFSYFGEKPTLNGRLLPGISFVYWVVIVGMIILRRKYMALDSQKNLIKAPRNLCAFLFCVVHRFFNPKKVL